MMAAPPSEAGASHVMVQQSLKTSLTRGLSGAPGSSESSRNECHATSSAVGHNLYILQLEMGLLIVYLVNNSHNMR